MTFCRNMSCQFAGARGIIFEMLELVKISFPGFGSVSSACAVMWFIAGAGAAATAIAVADE